MTQNLNIVFTPSNQTKKILENNRNCLNFEINSQLEAENQPFSQICQAESVTVGLKRPSQVYLIPKYPQQPFVNQNMIKQEDSQHKPCMSSQPGCTDDNYIDIDSIFNQQCTDLASKQKTNIMEETKNTVIDSSQQSIIPYNTKDQTKNVPKNYIKAVFTFVLENEGIIKKMFCKKRKELANCQMESFLDFIRTQKKNNVYTISRFKELWLDQTYGKEMRIIYAYFLRKRFLSYLYSSKIENKMGHVKHRFRIFDSLQDPESFNSIK